MIFLSAGEAYKAYEAARHRLPRARPAQGATSESIATLADIADRFDVFLLDAFGVLNIGETAIPGAVQRVADLQSAGKRVLVVSNAASVPQDQIGDKYRRLGFDFTVDDVVTSRATLLAFMTGSEGIDWGVMHADGSSLDDLAPLRMQSLRDDAAAYRDAGGFLLIGSGGWTEARQTLLENALRERPRRVLVANPDIVAPREDGLSAEPGHFAHRLAESTGVEPEFFGKPFANIFELAFQRTGPVDRSRVVMVGDSLHTDVLGAHAAGVASALITGYGFLAGEDAAAAIAASGIVPDFLVERP